MLLDVSSFESSRSLGQAGRSGVAERFVLPSTGVTRLRRGLSSDRAASTNRQSRRPARCKRRGRPSWPVTLRSCQGEGCAELLTIGRCRCSSAPSQTIAVFLTVVDRDAFFTNITLYWLTGTVQAKSGMRCRLLDPTETWRAPCVRCGFANVVCGVLWWRGLAACWTLPRN
jgi:hypothetical protein